MTSASDLRRVAPPLDPSASRPAVRLVWLVGRAAAARVWPELVPADPPGVHVELLLDLVPHAQHDASHAWAAAVSLSDGAHGTEHELTRAAIPTPRIRTSGTDVALDVPGLVSLNLRDEQVRYAHVKTPEAVGLRGGRYRIDRVEVNAEALA